MRSFCPDARRGRPPAPLSERGYVNMYVSHVQQSDTGADFDFLVGKSGSEVTRDSHV